MALFLRRGGLLVVVVVLNRRALLVVHLWFHGVSLLVDDAVREE